MLLILPHLILSPFLLSFPSFRTRRRYAYIPLLPVAIQGLVSDAPMPLLVGMHTANVEQGIYAQDEAVVVDVDRDKIRSVAHARAVTPLPQYVGETEDK